MSVGSIFSENAAGRRWLNTGSWTRAADAMLALTAAVLPWSTSLTAIFISLFLVMLVPTIEWRAFLELLKRPVCYLPLLLVAMAIAATLWATDVPWPARVHGINPTLKLLVIPFLFYHYERSSLASWPAFAFLASCALLMLTSWLMFLGLDVAMKSDATMGVPVKNYIDQSQEFALCSFALAGLAARRVRSQRWMLAIGAALLVALFMVNMLFVASSRTVLVCIAVLLVVFAVKNFSRFGILVLFIGAMAAAAAAWSGSSYLKERVGAVSVEYQLYKQNNAITSTGQRLEYWRKSIKFIESAPFIGHGTGATRTLFEKDAIGQTGVSADVIGNPHNQTFNVAIQWGGVGVVILFAMWIVHARLFSGPSMTAYVGLLGVIENIVGSIFNSHLFDFTEGWMYVLVVGVAGGTILRSAKDAHHDA